MKVKKAGKVKDYRSVWLENSTIWLINQQKLPWKFELYRSEQVEKTVQAIEKMIVRGAPAIGATAAYGIAQAALDFDGNELKKLLECVRKAACLLKAARPTAHDLADGVNFVFSKVKKAHSVREAKQIAKEKAEFYANRSVERCKKIGKYGEKLIPKKAKILTHCNAGALACVDHGTALAPIRISHYKGKKPHVFVSETRPRLQGRLTAWELEQEGIDHTLIVDSASGWLISKRKIDLVLVGADRIAQNGDVANKIGTYQKAVLAKENKIPFYVAAPKSTIDLESKSGDQIEIEERSREEITKIRGIRGKIKIHPPSASINPAFDITPSNLISKFISEHGIFSPEKIRNLK